LDEQAFRYNERKNDDSGRFLEVLNGLTGRRLTYQKLTGKEETVPVWKTRQERGKRGRVRVRVSSSMLDLRASVPLQLRFPFSVQQRSREWVAETAQILTAFVLGCDYVLPPYLRFISSIKASRSAMVAPDFVGHPWRVPAIGVSVFAQRRVCLKLTAIYHGFRYRLDWSIGTYDFLANQWLRLSVSPSRIICYWREENGSSNIELRRAFCLYDLSLDGKTARVQKLFEIPFSIKDVKKRADGVLCHLGYFFPGFAFCW
jgi:hypothetical protein